VSERGAGVPPRPASIADGPWPAFRSSTQEVARCPITPVHAVASPITAPRAGRTFPSVRAATSRWIAQATYVIALSRSPGARNAKDASLQMEALARAARRVGSASLCTDRPQIGLTGSHRLRRPRSRPLRLTLRLTWNAMERPCSRTGRSTSSCCTRSRSTPRASRRRVERRGAGERTGRGVPAPRFQRWLCVNPAGNRDKHGPAFRSSTQEVHTS
jgi:hypothetical protein